jgi:hypothetical protein
MRSFITAAILAFGISSGTSADLNATVQRLYQQCKSEDPSPSNEKTDSLACLAYISGVGDTMQALGVEGVKAVFSICGKPSYGAMAQAFVNWAEANPRD